ncbi:ESX secretion-associated protein EspG [Nocardia acidivorans]|uniref:ESX secretion-associated protein EspG n=1 Tax=Nocardia acidivorans TaxID=404580 RepID=UPI00082BA8A7|nr:ESX secretion-associated protein EspG [Nocardia acidivorans]
MTTTWRFTDDELYAVWQGVTEESLPAPLFYTCRNSSWVSYMRELADHRQRLRDRVNPGFIGVLECIRNPDIRIEAQGWSGQDRRDPAASIRIAGARQAGRGFLIMQEPGETIGHAKGFTVTEFDALELGRRIAEALPPVDAGQQGDIVLTDRTQSEQDYYFGQSIVGDPMTTSSTARSKAFLAAPHVRAGVIEVIQGQSKFGPRGILRHRLDWRDLEEDGRYLIADGTPRTAFSADTNRMTSLINSRIADVVRAIKDERG